MKKRFIYLICFMLFMFVGINNVDAASEMVCKYDLGGTTELWLYCNGSDCKTTKYSTSSGNYTFETFKVKSVTYDKGSNKCPSKANKDGGSSYKFGKGWIGNKKLKSDGTIYSGSYNGWSASYAYTGQPDVNISVSSNKFGFVTYSISNTAYDDIVEIDDFDFNSVPDNLCGTSVTELGKFIFNKSQCSNRVKSSNSSSGTSSTGSGTSSTGSGTSSTGSGTSSTGSGTSNSNVLGVGGYCLYKNIGYCSLDNGNINGDCGAFSNDSSGKINSYFARSPYIIIKYASNEIQSVYMPKSITSEIGSYVADPSIISSLNSAYSIFDGSVDEMSNLVSNYFKSYSKNQISSINSWNTSNEKTNGCYNWFNNVSGTNGDDYEDSMYFYQYYNTNSENNGSSESPEIVDQGVEVEGGEGPYYCIYNTTGGQIALKYNSQKTRLYLLSSDIENIYHPYACEYSDCSTVSGISFSGYGGYESNDGSFQSDIVAGVCPAQINYLNRVLTICKVNSSDCVNGDAGYFGENPSFSNSFIGDSSTSPEIDITDCSQIFSQDLIDNLNTYMMWFRIFVPILVVILGSVDFTKAVFSNGEDGMKKAQQAFIKRLLIAVVIFLIPSFINLLLNLANTVWGWNAGTCGIE